MASSLGGAFVETDRFEKTRMAVQVEVRIVGAEFQTRFVLKPHVPLYILARRLVWSTSSLIGPFHLHRAICDPEL